MTTSTPISVRYELYANLSGYGNLPAVSIRASADIDRDIFATATLTLAGVSDALWALLDPRTSTPRRITWRIIQYGRDAGGSEYEVGRLPVVATGTDTANMWIRTANRNHLTGRVIVELATGESLMRDKKRISGATVNTGASTVAGLCTWTLNDVLGSTPDYYYAPILYSTAIPSGDRRLMQSGEDFISLIQPELDSIGCRLLDAWGRQWRGIVRDATEYGALLLSTHTKTDYDAIITEAEETVSRDGDWADGVLIKYNPPSGTVSYQASGSGVNTKGVVVTRDRVPAAANAADPMAGRYRARGADFTVTARIRFAQIALATKDSPSPQEVRFAFVSGRTIIAKIRAIEWDTATGLMSIRAQSDAFG